MGTVEQCLNLNLIIGKYVEAKQRSILLAFLDLSSTFDRVNRSKLWDILGEMGLSADMINFLRAMHMDVNAHVRYSTEGETTESIRLLREFRQGCVLAPIIVLLYINSLNTCLSENGADLRRVKSSRVPSLLYTDDAVLMAQTANRLKLLVDRFVMFMDDLDLDTNISNTHYMVCGRRPTKTRPIDIKGQHITRVSTFPYLGISFDYQSNWLPCISSCYSKFTQACCALFRFSLSVR